MGVSMKTNRIIKVCLVAAIIASAVLPLAYAETLRTSQRVDEIVAQQQRIRASVTEAKDGWNAIPQDKRGELLTRQERMLGLLAGKQTLGDLNPTDQVEVVNTLEWIKALANNAEDDRQVCNRERETGSHRVTTVCQSVGSIRKQRERTKDGMRLGERQMAIPPRANSQ